MKLGPVTKVDKRNVMSEYCDVIAIFPVYGQFGAIRKLDSRCIVCKTYIFINNSLFILQKLKIELKDL